MVAEDEILKDAHARTPGQWAEIAKRLSLCAPIRACPAPRSALPSGTDFRDRDSVIVVVVDATLP